MAMFFRDDVIASVSRRNGKMAGELKQLHSTRSVGLSDLLVPPDLQDLA